MQRLSGKRGGKEGGGTISNIKLGEVEGVGCLQLLVDYLDKSGPKFGSVEWFCTRGGGGLDVWNRCLG